MTCWLSGERSLPFGLLVSIFPQAVKIDEALSQYLGEEAQEAPATEGRNKMSRDVRRNRSSGFQSRTDTNRAV